MIDHLANAVAAVTTLQWIELAVITVGACSMLALCWKLLQNHPVMGAVCGLLLAAFLPMLIDLVQLNRLQAEMFAILLIMLLLGVDSYLTHH